VGWIRSFVPWSLVVVAALAGGPRPALAGDNVVVVHFEGQAPIAEVKGAANVVVPACRGVEWQRFDAELARFVPVPGPGCGPMVPAIPVPAAGLKVPADVRLREGDNVRAVALIGVGCRPDQPLQLAKCARLEAVESAPVIVPPAAPEPG
jgi:hypothetical protein